MNSGKRKRFNFLVLMFLLIHTTWLTVLREYGWAACGATLGLLVLVSGMVVDQLQERVEMQLKATEWALENDLYEPGSIMRGFCIVSILLDRVRRKDLPMWWIVKYVPNEAEFQSALMAYKLQVEDWEDACLKKGVTLRDLIERSRA